MGIEEYLTEIKNQIRDKKAREFASDELKAHIEDRAEGLQKKGMDHDSEVLQAVKEMGDPVSVGVNLDRIHRPHLEWKFFLYVIYISILSVGVLGVLFAAMPRESVIGNQFAEGLLLKHTIGVLFGLVMMIIVYRLDYTILAGKSRLIAAVLLISLAVLIFIFGVSINGAKRWIRILGIVFQTHALYLLYLPIFAGILYDYRNKGAGALFKIFLWMIAPAFLQSLYDAGWMPFVIFMLFSESILFMIALNKNWYRVNKRKVFIGMGIGFIAVITYFFGSMTADYQKARIQAWLSHWGLNFGSIDGNTIRDMNYNNTCLDNIFLRSNFIGKSDSAIEAVQLTPEASVDYILASIAATCGKLTVAVIMISLIILAVYVFRISVKQKNSLGSIVGCSCGIVIAVQAVSNILIVTGLFPLMGTTLPFFSLGITNIIIDYILLGLVLSIYRYQDIRVEKEPVTTLLA